MQKIDTKTRKKFRIRNKLKKISSNDRYRLTVTRSSKNISAQIIDDNKHTTILSASSNEKEIRELKLKNKSEMSEVVAKNIAKRVPDFHKIQGDLSLRILSPYYKKRQIL